MKLHIENAPDHAKWIRDAFSVITKAYGIEDSPWEIRVRVDGKSEFLGDAGGVASYDPKGLPNTVLITLGQRADDPLGRAKIGGAYSMLEVFCHEMIHVKQHVKDGLRGDMDRYGTWYKGRFYPGHFTDLLASLGGDETLPWEQEAYSQMRPLADKVRQEIAQ